MAAAFAKLCSSVSFFVLGISSVRAAHKALRFEHSYVPLVSGVLKGFIGLFERITTHVAAGALCTLDASADCFSLAGLFDIAEGLLMAEALGTPFESSPWEGASAAVSR